MTFSIPIPIHRLFAFLTNIWSFMLTLVRSLLALFSFRQRSRDPFALPRVNRTRKDALTRAHNHLRPMLLTPRTLTLSLPSADNGQLGRGTRTSSALTLYPGVNDNPEPPTHASASGPVPQSPTPQRTSPKLDPDDVELALSAILSSSSGGSSVPDHSGPGPTGAGVGLLATRTSDDTPDTPSSTLPLTPPDPCYLGPMPSTTDCPYAEPWPTNSALDRSREKLPGSPLKVSFQSESGIPVPVIQAWNPDSSSLCAEGGWSPVPIWTSTPREQNKVNLHSVPLYGGIQKSVTNHASRASGLQKVPMAMRIRPTIGAPNNDGSLQSTSSHSSTSQQHDRRTKRVPIPRPRAKGNQLDTYTWRRHGARLPGKPGGTAHSSSQSDHDLCVNRPIVEWYDAHAYIPSPVDALSPPVDGHENSEEVPLSRLLKVRARKASAFRMRRPLSEGSLFVDTPTKVGIPRVREGQGATDKDPFEILLFQFKQGQAGTVTGSASAGVVDVV